MGKKGENAKIAVEEKRFGPSEWMWMLIEYADTMITRVLADCHLMSNLVGTNTRPSICLSLPI